MSAAPGLPRSRLALATGGTMLALLLAALDQTVVGTALPRILAELRGVDYYPWAISAYLASSTSMTPIAGKLGDLFGRKPVLLIGVLGFMGGSALCGFSSNMAELVAFRAVQGLFAGFIFATTFAVVADLYPPERRGKIQGMLGGVFSVASVVGPVTGGLLTDSVGWRWVFFVNIPVGVVAALLIGGAMPFARTRASWRDIDFRGAAALVGFLAPLVIALSLVRDVSWRSPLVGGLLLVSALMLAVFLFTESRATNPIMPLQLFRNRSFSASVTIAFFSAFGMFATIIYGPLVFQGVLGLSPTDSGALTVPMAVGQLTAAVTTGILMQYFRWYRVLGVIGIAGMIAGLWLLSQATVSTNRLEASRDVLIIGLGLGVTYPLTMNTVQNALHYRFVGVASSQVQFFRVVGGTIATALLGTILTQRLPGNIQSQIAHLHPPPQVLAALFNGTGSGAQALFDPNRIAQVRAGLPPQLLPAFASTLEATRVGLAITLRDVFLAGAAVLVVALIASLFLREVPVGKARRRQEQAAAVARGPLAEPAAVAGADDMARKLAASDERIAQLDLRAAAAERRNEVLESRLRSLEEELARHQINLHQLGEHLIQVGRSIEANDGGSNPEAVGSDRPR